MFSTDELASEIEATIRDLDEQRHKLVGALLLLKPDTNIVQLPLRRGPRPRRTAEAA